MKKYLFISALAFAVLFTGCDKSDDDGNGDKGSGSSSGSENIVVSLSVTDIADNKATINVSLSEGKFYGAQLVEATNTNMVGIDYTSESKLITYVRENGVSVELPYTNTLTGLRADDEMLTAVIVFDSEGRVASSSYVDYKVWTVVGDPDSWSDDNDAGQLEENEW